MLTNGLLLIHMPLQPATTIRALYILNLVAGDGGLVRDKPDINISIEMVSYRS